MCNRHTGSRSPRSKLLVGLALGTVALAVALAGCSQSPYAPQAGVNGNGTTTIRYQPDTSNFPNPGRGFYNEPAPGDWAATAAAGDTLAMRYVHLDSYAAGALPGTFLSSFQSELAGVRGSGVKLILRFAYNRSAGSDAPLTVVLQQIGQLKPVLQQYSDVIAVVQAGFIGQWGEWHDSTNNLLTASNRRQIIGALLGAVPSSRDVDVRAPYWTRDIYPGGVTAETAYSGTAVSRLGQHNDCFLSTSSDEGTYTGSADRAYVQDVSAYTAMGGETCSAPSTSYNDCPSALNALATYHWDYLNAEYYTGTLDKWKSQGCYTEIAKRLGYRYVVNSFTTPGSLSPGGALNMSLNIANDGFGKLYNPRPMQLVLLPTDGSAGTVVTINADARKVLPGPGQTVDIPIDMTLPSTVAAGTYNVYINLPDASANLSSDPAYSIRLADAGMWMQYSGFNYLNTQVTVQ